MALVTWQTGLTGFLAGLLIALVTTPAGVSGAVFLLPVQLSVLHVPSPAVTPTNLLFNIVAVPGALLRYRRSGHLAGPLTRLLAAGTLPGVIAGAVIRVLAVPGPRAAARSSARSWPAAASPSPRSPLPPWPPPS